MKKYFSIQEFIVQIKECRDKNTLKKLKAVYLYRIQKKPAKKVALIIHTSINNIYQWAHKYKKNGISLFEPKPRGGRRREILTFEQEMVVLNEIAEDGKKGLIVIADKIKKNVEKITDKKFFKNYAYSLLKRHGWRKVIPRPKNPKSSIEVQEKFKNNFLESVQNIVKTFNKQDERPIKVLFGDEGIFGRINKLKASWAPKGVRPIVGAQLVRQFLNVFSVVCPLTGSNYSLISSDSDTTIMNIFLNEVSNHYHDYRLVIFLDQASWHKSKDLQKFDNIRLLYLPPGSPELNPAEHIWEHVREKYFANKVFDSIDSLEDLLIQAFSEIHFNPSAIQSLVSFHWAKSNLND